MKILYLGYKVELPWQQSDFEKGKVHTEIEKFSFPQWKHTLSHLDLNVSWAGDK